MSLGNDTPHPYTALEREHDKLKAERARMRPVVDAAVAWRVEPPMTGNSTYRWVAKLLDMERAIDAYINYINYASARSGEQPDGPSELGTSLCRGFSLAGEKPATGSYDVSPQPTGAIPAADTSLEPIGGQPNENMPVPSSDQTGAGAGVSVGPLPGTATPWNGNRVGRVGDGSARSHEEQIWNDDDIGVFIIMHDGSDKGKANVAAMLHRASNWDALLAERDTTEARVREVEEYNHVAAANEQKLKAELDSAGGRITGYVRRVAELEIERDAAAKRAEGWEREFRDADRWRLKYLRRLNAAEKQAEKQEQAKEMYRFHGIDLQRQVHALDAKCDSLRRMHDASQKQWAAVHDEARHQRERVGAAETQCVLHEQGYEDEHKRATRLQERVAHLEREVQICHGVMASHDDEPSAAAVRNPTPFFIVCKWNGSDCQFVETELEDGTGVGPAVAGEWGPHPLHKEFTRLGPYVLATALIGSSAAEADGMPDEAALVEALAAQEHERWSGWEKYRGSKGSNAVNLNRWKRQRETSYADLSEREKESDRVEARKTIALLCRLGAFAVTPALVPACGGDVESVPKHVLEWCSLVTGQGIPAVREHVGDRVAKVLEWLATTLAPAMVLARGGGDVKLIDRFVTDVWHRAEPQMQALCRAIIADAGPVLAVLRRAAATNERQSYGMLVNYVRGLRVLVDALPSNLLEKEEE